MDRIPLTKLSKNETSADIAPQEFIKTQAPGASQAAQLDASTRAHFRAKMRTVIRKLADVSGVAIERPDGSQVPITELLAHNAIRDKLGKNVKAIAWLFEERKGASEAEMKAEEEAAKASEAAAGRDGEGFMEVLTEVIKASRTLVDPSVRDKDAMDAPGRYRKMFSKRAAGVRETVTKGIREATIPREFKGHIRIHHEGVHSFIDELLLDAKNPVWKYYRKHKVLRKQLLNGKNRTERFA